MGASKDDASLSSAASSSARTYRCLCSVEDGGSVARYLSANDLLTMIGACRQFDINITSMPLAQRPTHHLKLMFKFLDESREELWVRIDLPADTTAKLITGMLEVWGRKA